MNGVPRRGHLSSFGRFCFDQERIKNRRQSRSSGKSTESHKGGRKKEKNKKNTGREKQINSRQQTYDPKMINSRQLKSKMYRPITLTIPIDATGTV